MSTAEQRPQFAHGALTHRIIGVFYDIYAELGYGFLESVYEAALRLALAEVGLTVRRQVPILVQFRAWKIGEFRANLVVEDSVVVELKAVRALDPSHEAQLLNVLKATTLEVGLLLNFGPRPQFKRLVFSNERKQQRSTG